MQSAKIDDEKTMSKCSNVNKMRNESNLMTKIAEVKLKEVLFLFSYHWPTFEF